MNGPPLHTDLRATERQWRMALWLLRGVALLLTGMGLVTAALALLLPDALPLLATLPVLWSGAWLIRRLGVRVIGERLARVGHASRLLFGGRGRSLRMRFERLTSLSGPLAELEGEGGEPSLAVALMVNNRQLPKSGLQPVEFFWGEGSDTAVLRLEDRRLVLGQLLGKGELIVAERRVRRLAVVLVGSMLLLVALMAAMVFWQVRELDRETPLALASEGVAGESLARHPGSPELAVLEPGGDGEMAHRARSLLLNVGLAGVVTVVLGGVVWYLMAVRNRRRIGELLARMG